MSDETPAPSSTALPIPAFTPVPRAKERSNGWKPAVQCAFIEVLADSGSVRTAARLVGRSERSAYQLRRHPEGAEFAAAWDAALAHGVRRIEDVAMDRALNGVEVPVYSYGKLVGTRRVFNDRLLMFLLRNRAPERFAEGRAKAMNALDLTRLEREKKRWRREWELERGIAPSIDAARARQVIDQLLEQLRLRVREREQAEWARLSGEARAAHAAYQRLRERDLAHFRTGGGGSADTDTDEDVALPPEGWRVGRAPKEEEPWDGIRRLKDEGWD